MTRVFLKDYKPPTYTITETWLEFHIISKEKVRLHSRLLFKCCSDEMSVEELELNGEELSLEEILLDGEVLDSERYRISDEGLVLIAPPPVFELKTTVVLNPAKNVSLEGLFVSGDTLCTQNEAQGFRRVTYYLDRPDVLSKFKISICANPFDYPVLLAGGNLVEEGLLTTGEYRVVYEDPIPKPCYLVAIVVGNLVKLEELYQTKGGREVKLQLYVDLKNRTRGGFALASLRKAMKWDEAVFGLEYDLDEYKIVAVDSFNFGAMENKGLNIFNAALVLADQRIATDEDFKRIESVVAHEYFHNWSGNRVTLRDWFQLTWKEGLTVYRDQEFMADAYSRAVKRIEDVGLIRGRQFREDAGPLSHPIRPVSYEEVDNFYTTTVYEKGAEVVRILATLLGRDLFHSKVTGFLRKFDGKAITIEDFLNYLEHSLASQSQPTETGIDFSPEMWKQFRNWYDVKGTPCVEVEEHYDKEEGDYTVDFKQSIPTNPKAPPLLIPIRWALVDKDSKETLEEGLFPLQLSSEKMVFRSIKNRPYLSLGRDFSAPIKIERDISLEEQIWAFSTETDPVTHSNILDQIIRNVFLLYCEKWSNDNVVYDGAKGNLFVHLFTALRTFVLQEKDLLYIAKCLIIPSSNVLMNEMKCIDFEMLKNFKRAWSSATKQFLAEHFMERYEALKMTKAVSAIPERTLRNRLLTILVNIDVSYLSLAKRQYKASTHMTDKATALELLLQFGDKTTRKVFSKRFYKEWKDVSLVMNKWLSAQANIEDESIFSLLQTLTRDSVYNEKEPNKVYALWGTFAHQNVHAFNHSSGKGYTQVGKMIIHLDKINPSVSARLITAFQHVKRLPDSLRAQAEGVLEMIEKGVHSKNAMEIVRAVRNS